MQPERMQDLEVLLGHSFREKGFLLNALSHSSIKTDRRPSNERLEFLGDSVLGLIVSDALYRRFPEDDEGTLTRIKSQAVSRSTLQRVAVAMGLDRFILVGKGVMKREIPASLLGNLFEAIVGAIYLDAGLAAARKFVMRHLDIIVEEIVQDRAERNYKSMLQHYCQREKGGVPTYRVLQESGPAHSRAFDVAVILNGREFGRARGISKKEAEQGSARAAMIHFRAIDESARQAVRGAGTILRVGPEGAPRKRNGRRRGKGGKKEEAPAAEPAGGRRKTSSRSRRRAPAKPPATDEAKAPAAKTDAEPAKKKKKKKRKSRSRKSAAPKAAPKPAEPEPKPKKKTTTRRRRRKKKT
ncbi:MAG: ribonuclease III [Planctomycetota bacterium]|jgi:ribonuclease-3